MKKSYFLKLLTKRLSGTISDEEAIRLEQAIAQNQDFKQVAEELSGYLENKTPDSGSKIGEQHRKTWEMIGCAENDDFTTRYDHENQVKPLFSWSYFTKIAAVFLVLLSCTFLAYNFLNKVPPMQFDTLKTTTNKIYKTLDDGTKVHLNKGSSIRYNQGFGKEKRELFLDGEAFFEVTKNPVIPLVIYARNLRIEVKGTAFNVNAYLENASIEVALFRGLVEITSQLNKAHKVLLKPNEKLIAAVQPERLDQEFKIVDFATARQLQEIKWTQDSIVFKKEKLKDLVSRLEQKYTIKIDIRNTELKEKRFSGTFAAEGLKEVLEALKLSYPFTYTISNQLVIIK